MPDAPHPDDAFLDRLLDVPGLLGATVSPNCDLLSWSWAQRGAPVATYLRQAKEEGKPVRLSILKRGWGGPEQDDVLSAVEALVAKGLARKGRIGITGTGFGGYCAWWAITHWPLELLAAAAPVSAMADLALHHKTTRPENRAEIEAALGGTPFVQAQRYRERSPLSHAGGIKGRLLLVHGLRDPMVTAESFAAARAALDATKRPYEALTFEDEGHGVCRAANRRVLWRRLADFFEAAFAKRA